MWKNNNVLPLYQISRYVQLQILQENKNGFYWYKKSTKTFRTTSAQSTWSYIMNYFQQAYKTTKLFFFFISVNTWHNLHHVFKQLNFKFLSSFLMLTRSLFYQPNYLITRFVKITTLWFYPILICLFSFFFVKTHLLWCIIVILKIY